ncbi:ABC-2 type transport system ATP-binding protein [Lihuaxuella thermophila]|uniref:ABC-2 type transport system ATP-binding protein n=1 Tax=Lihuaxuella thermophila TaxID=1173111 RepID=A0A1H8IK32_9BACL|nr:ABC-2 type transport system ATP-binding protein [Lihuaxuella thermophila]
MEEAEQLADQIAILHEGKIVAEGTPTQLKKLLPRGHIELKFRHEQDVHRAHDILGGDYVNLHREHHMLKVTTDGSIKQLTAILNRLEHAGIPVDECLQKQPTLEDVFLTIIGENYERADA